MKKEKHICQNCEKDFTIEPDDFVFYEKIKAPAPTWCQECRAIRRMMWRNERALYKKPSDSSGKEIICLYPKDTSFKVYDQKEWWSDEWDALAFGRIYNFSKPFFTQFQELQKEVPRISIFNVNCLNSDYTNQSYQNKNCYLCFSITTSEDSAFCGNIGDIKYGFDLLFTLKSELVYETIDSENCYNSSFLINCRDCVDSSFLFDCKNCRNCIGAVGLRNKNYVFFGKQLSKEEYEKKTKEFNLGSFKKQKEAIDKFWPLTLNFPRRAQRFKNCFNCTGDTLSNCKKVQYGFGAYDLEDCKYVNRMYSCKDVYDSYGMGKSELIYETIGNEEVYNVQLSNVTTSSRGMVYCDLCFNCEDCFGCVGLKKKQYCLLNKQYTKEEYEELVPKIIAQMNDMPYKDEKGRTYKYGEFFPPGLSPFAYNETIAQEYFPLTKEQAVEQGYRWKDPEKREYKITMKAQDIPDHIKDASDSITNEVIECASNPSVGAEQGCTTAFKIIPQELGFYKKMNLPLPRFCPNCRHYQRVKQRNPLRLWERQCMCTGKASASGAYQNTTEHEHGPNPCPNTFETTYSPARNASQAKLASRSDAGGPDRKEIVYCEACYQKEVI